MQKQFLLLGCLFFLGITFGTAQWTQKKGTGYYKVGAWFLEANQHYTDNGLLDPNATRGIFVTSLYGQHGITDKITLVGYISFTRVYQKRTNLYLGQSRSTTRSGKQFWRYRSCGRSSNS